MTSADRFVAEVKDLASDGRGVVTHPSGLTVFVSGVWQDEQGEFEMIDRKARSGTARLIQLLKPSEDRVEAPCRFYGIDRASCGGCAWQFVSYRAQIAAKQRRVESQLRKIGAHHRIQPIQPSPIEFGYRNRAQFKTNGDSLGFVSARSNELVDVEACPVLTASNQETLSLLRQRLPTDEWKAKSKNWNSVHIDDSLPVGEYSFNKRLRFRQGNDAQNTFMRDWLYAKLAKLIKDNRVLELFSGDGNLTEVIASSGFSSVLAIDVVEDAISRLKQKNLPSVEARTADLYVKGELDAVIESYKPDILVLDPPRDGFASLADSFSKDECPDDVFYISCNLSTLTRDLKFLLGIGYKTREIQPLDLFPQTPHIESLVHLRRKRI